MTTSHPGISLDLIHEALENGAAAFRIRARLQPAGGAGDKVFPPTYAGGGDGKVHSTKYATELRLVDGERRPTVLLDSVASQANRMELLLLELARAARIQLPVLSVDFSESFEDLGKISALEAPHRVYDAILRDSMLGECAFRRSSVGQEITHASTRDARAMLRYCPTALLFGAWDSTGPLGGMGNKFQRALVSEVIGVDFEAGSKVGSRIDPLQISASVRLVVPSSNSDDWAVGDGARAKSRPSEVNHSNIAPTRDEESGGVTFDHGLHTAVLSVPAVRRLRFGPWTDDKENAARSVLLALGVLAMAAQHRAGYDFRSRCSLVAEGPHELELVLGDGSTRGIAMDVDAALSTYAEAVAQASQAGVSFELEEVLLSPMPKLVQLIEASRAVLAAGKAEDAE